MVSGTRDNPSPGPELPRTEQTFHLYFFENSTNRVHDNHELVSGASCFVSEGRVTLAGGTIS